MSCEWEQDAMEYGDASKKRGTQREALRDL